MEKIQIGRLLCSNTRACVVGCPPSQQFPAFGSMVVIPLDEKATAYGLISDIHIDDDGLVRQLATTPEIAETVIQDNRLNRNVPVEMSVLFIGCGLAGQISHLLPPRPPLSLDSMYACDEKEIRAFTTGGQFGYLRHILDAQDFPTTDLLAAHLLQAGSAHRAQGDTEWFNRAIDKIITQLRDDYPRLMTILLAVADVQAELSGQVNP
jgi:hypothetical protein